MSNSAVRRVSRQDIQLVQNLIERCLQLYMSQKEVVDTLLVQAKIEPGFTELVWQKLEEENREFFKAYYLRLMVKHQILEFNKLLEQQVQLMRQINPTGVAPMPNSNGSNIPPLHQSSACYAPDPTGSALNPENMQNPVGSSLSNAFSNGGSSFSNVFNNGGSNLPNTFSNGGSSLPNAFSNEGSNLPNTFSNGGSSLPNAFSNGGSNLPNTFSNEGSNLPNAFNNGGSSLPNAFNNGGSSLRNTFSSGGSCLPAAFSNGGSNLPNTFSNGGSNLPNTFSNSSSSVQRNMNTAREMPVNANRIDATLNVLPNQNSNTGLMSGRNGEIKSEVGYSSNSSYMFGADGNALETRPVLRNAPVASYSSVESNGQPLNDSLVDADSSSFGFLGQIPRNFSLSDLTADFSQSSDILESYTRSPFLETDPDNFMDSRERIEHQGENRRLDTISEGLSYEDFGSE